jgi:aminoglycoside 2''-adenylyltransferase
LPLWLSGGWAIDAYEHAITRAHGDIDLTYPANAHEVFVSLLQTLGAGAIETNDYGFLTHAQGVLLDCEPCHWHHGHYEIEDTPPGSCPPAFAGSVAGVAVRCVSWEALLWDYLYFLEEAAPGEWQPKHHQDYQRILVALGTQRVEALKHQFADGER